MLNYKRRLGDTGELQAADFLQKRGYRIIKRNFRCKLGEIDIIASDKGTFCFVEVKTRTSDRFGSAEEAVSSFKRKKLCRTAVSFLKENKLMEARARFDVVCVNYRDGLARFELIKNAFDMEDKFTY